MLVLTAKRTGMISEDELVNLTISGMGMHWMITKNRRCGMAIGFGAVGRLSIEEVSEICFLS